MNILQAGTRASGSGSGRRARTVSPGEIAIIVVVTLISMRMWVYSPRAASGVWKAAWYAPYFSGVVLTFFWFLEHRKPGRRTILITGSDALAMGMLLTAVGLAGLWSGRGWENPQAAAALVACYAPFLFRVRTSGRAWSAGALAIIAVALGVSLVRSGTGGLGDFDVVTGQARTETDWSFDTGAIALAAVIKGEWGLVAAALFSTTVGLKRGALIAVAIAVGAWMLARRMPWLQRGACVAGAYAAGLVIFTVAYEDLSIRFVDTIAPFVGGIESPNAFLSGRLIMYKVVMDAFYSLPWEARMFGAGHGAAKELFWYGVAHPHNDYVRILYEYGIIGSILLSTAFAGWLRGVRGASVVALFHVIILGSNNNLLYVDFAVTLWLVRNALWAPENRRKGRRRQAGQEKLARWPDGLPEAARHGTGKAIV